MLENYDSNSIVGILLLSDLHFNHKNHYGDDPLKYSRHKTCLEKLLIKMSAIPDKWKIDCIAVTGDVGYQGHPEDYVKAKKWLGDLTGNLGIDPSDVVMCPGNHDMDQNALIVPAYPTSKRVANDQLRLDNLNVMKRPFSAFEEFQREFCRTPFELGFATDPDPPHQVPPFYQNYLVGRKIVKNINFVSFNSAWYCRDSRTDKKKLWLGESQFYAMQAASQLMDYENSDGRPITITLFHHPPEILHPKDGFNRDGIYDNLIDTSNFIFTGHIHELKPDFIQHRGHARTLINGCVYDNPNYGNICSIIKIDLQKHYFWFMRLSWDGRTWNFSDSPHDEGEIFPKKIPMPAAFRRGISEGIF